MRSLTKALLLSVLALLSFSALAERTITYYHTDLTGSPVAATDEVGRVIWRKQYAPYGEASGNDGQNRRGFTGHVEDSNGLVYAGARYYDPGMGRFLSVDPVGFVESNPHSFNRYAYANNNPYKFVDPDGREVQLVINAKAQLSGGGSGSVGMGWFVDISSQGISVQGNPSTLGIGAAAPEASGVISVGGYAESGGTAQDRINRVSGEGVALNVGIDAGLSIGGSLLGLPSDKGDNAFDMKGIGGSIGLGLSPTVVTGGIEFSNAELSSGGAKQVVKFPWSDNANKKNEAK